MKWALIVYFSIAGTWHTAEELEMHGWYRMTYPDVEQCIEAQHHFTDNNPDITKIRASCEEIQG